MSVNLSARQFYREDLAQRISEIVKGEECEPSWIELEVTETSLLHDLDAIRKVLHQLRDEGFTVAIDDFGTGYSSLTHLKHFPIDTLKIDISFIADLETDPQDAAITEAIIGLARGLGLKVVAEGVGTREQLEFLDVRGCDCFQGYWVEQAAAGRRVRRVRRASPTAGAVAQADAQARLTLSSVCSQPSSASAATFHFRLQHQHVRHAGQDRRRHAVMPRGRAATSPGRADPIAVGAQHEHRRAGRCGTAQCRRSDRSNSARGDSALRWLGRFGRIVGRDVAAEIERPQRLKHCRATGASGRAALMCDSVVGMRRGEPRRHRQQTRRRHRRQQRGAAHRSRGDASARRSRRPSSGRSSTGGAPSVPATCSTSAT